MTEDTLKRIKNMPKVFSMDKVKNIDFFLDKGKYLEKRFIEVCNEVF